MSLMVILIPFLLLTAVFGKSSILNLYLPSEPENETTSQKQEDLLIPQVALTEKGLILSESPGKIVPINKKDGDFDFKMLQEKLIEMRKNPRYSQNIIILPETNLRYQSLITAMDTCRQFKDDTGELQPLFPVISIGEYRKKKGT